jgi:phosphoglycerol transferase MdoB-like AlkP superfamily enzyme
LYTKAIKLIKKQSAPYFLAMQTISSHEPYETPYGKGEESTIKYVDKSIFDFYQSLEREHFFDNGILIILADHRKIDNASNAEKEKYGQTTPSRILGTIVGKGIKK